MAECRYGLYLVIFSGVSFKFLGRDKELTSDEFLKFQEDIQFDILKMEFDKLGPDENNMISQKAFGKLSSFLVGLGVLTWDPNLRKNPLKLYLAQMIVLHANFTDEKQRKIKKKIKKLNKKVPIQSSLL